MKAFLGLALCLGALSMAVAVPKEVSKTAATTRFQDLNPMMMERIAEAFRTQVAAKSSLEIAQLLDDSVSGQGNSLTANCDAMGNSMHCCVKVSLGLGFPFYVSFNEQVCISGEYDPKELGVHLRIDLPGLAPIEKTLSATNPPPICLNLPYTLGLLGVCVRVEHLWIDFDNGGFQGCFSFEAKAFFNTVASLDLGCVNAQPPSNP